MAEYSILIVEDEFTLRRLLEYRLGRQYAVRTAANGQEALQKIEEALPHLIISDIMMPGMDGFVLQETLQSKMETRAIPFIFLTAKADDSSRVKGVRTGVDDYITKPFDIDYLLLRVERLLERTQLYQNRLDDRIGKDFSSKLLPKKMPEVPGYRVYFQNLPREHGGGDFFDWILVENNICFICIGDVMGKGLQAKFYAFSFLGYIRSTIHAMLRTTSSPAELMRRVNQMLIEDAMMDDTFASLLLMRWEPALNRVTYTNAGHCRPVLITPRGAEIVSYSDLVLGLEAQAEYRDTIIELPPGSALISYTDGLVEQVERDGQALGETGLVQVLSKTFGSPDALTETLQTVLQRSNTSHFSDDVLVFWIERDQQPQQSRLPRWTSFADVDLNDVR
jgi:serine phosphatase RsbU (regulator of sigma subunit)